MKWCFSSALALLVVALVVGAAPTSDDSSTVPVKARLARRGQDLPPASPGAHRAEVQSQSNIVEREHEPDASKRPRTTADLMAKKRDRSSRSEASPSSPTTAVRGLQQQDVEEFLHSRTARKRKAAANTRERARQHHTKSEPIQIHRASGAESTREHICRHVYWAFISSSLIFSLALFIGWLFPGLSPFYLKTRFRRRSSTVDKLNITPPMERLSQDVAFDEKKPERYSDQPDSPC